MGSAMLQAYEKELDDQLDAYRSKNDPNWKKQQLDDELEEYNKKKETAASGEAAPVSDTDTKMADT